jgi:dTDP-4-dehydrorhamnose reductase
VEEEANAGKRKILVLGGTGLLGSALVPELKSAGHAVLAPTRAELDILNYDRVLGCASSFLLRQGYGGQVRSEIIVNCAGYNRVDDCERNQTLALQLNAEAAGNLARAARATGATLVQVSSDYIFSGEKAGEYVEDDAPGPLSVYGRSKLEGEKLVRELALESCIIRTSWLFGPGGENFVSKILAKWKSGATELRAVSDERGRPTYSLDLAHALRLALERNLRGIYHFCNQGAGSWLELAREVFEILGSGPKLVPLSAKAYGLPARRPKNSALATGKIERALGLEIRRHREALGEYLESLEISRRA